MHPSNHPAGHGGRTIGTPGRYEAFTFLMFAGRRRTSLRQLVLAAAVAPGNQVLDVGCGDGLLTALAAAAAAPGGHTLGLDAAPEMVAHARRRHPEADFEVATAEAIPEPAGRFDVVLCSLVLHHLAPDARTAAIGEMVRVLKPGGRLLLAEFTVPSAGPWRVVAHVLGLEGMGRSIPDLAPLLDQAGMSRTSVGVVPPWIRYARGTR
jgi:ubiquinone/menaquinone biosynthesis C-methylase UbiE